MKVTAYTHVGYYGNAIDQLMVCGIAAAIFEGVTSEDFVISGNMVDASGLSVLETANPALIHILS